MSPDRFEFSSTLDVDAAAQSFGAHGRVRIADAIRREDADALYTCLAREVPWRLSYNRGEQALLVDPAVARASGPAQQQLTQEIIAGARQGFQYAYYSYPMVTAYLAGSDPGLLLHRLLEWLTGPVVLDTVRRITGIDTLRKCDGQATCYLPGHFLTQHDDRGTGSEGRRVGYVLSLTQQWHPDWGGLLHFLADDGRQLQESWIPGYNTLVLFRVPVLHSVGYVAPFARQARFAITGWFRDV